MVCKLLPLAGKVDLGLMAHLLAPECLPLPAQLGLGLMPLASPAVQVDLGLMAQLLASECWPRAVQSRLGMLAHLLPLKGLLLPDSDGSRAAH